MKIIFGFVSLVILLATAGCDFDEDHHHHGGAYGGYYGEYPYHTYGHGEYRPYDRDHDWH